MVEPRDFHRFLELAERRSSQSDPESKSLEAIRDDIDALSEVLPEPKSTRQLVIHSVARLGLALLPISLWAGLGYGAFHVLLLFCLESLVCGGANGLRILFTAASPNGESVPYRIGMAAFYLALHTLPVLALSAGVWYLFAPNDDVRGLLTGVDPGGMASFLASEGLLWPTVAASGFLLIEVIGRSDYIDAYLPLGPGTVAQYGFTRPIALTCFVILFVLVAEAMGSAARGPHFAVYGAVFLIVARAFFDILNLWMPVLSRALFKNVEAFAGWAEREKRS